MEPDEQSELDPAGIFRRYETKEQYDRIYDALTHHPPKTQSQTARYEKLRERAKSLAYDVAGCCPDSREKSLAQTKIEEAVMWAIAAIARNE